MVQQDCVLYGGTSLATQPARLSMPGLRLTTRPTESWCYTAPSTCTALREPLRVQASTLLVDCIPLFHGTLTLVPRLEVALTLTDSWCKENSCVITGYDQASEHVKDASPNQVAENVASRIAEGFSNALSKVASVKFMMD